MNIKLLNLNNFKLFFLSFVFLFGRVFMGVEIGPIRIGELIIGFSAAYLIYNLLINLVKIRDLDPFNKNVSIITFLILTHFVYLLTSNGYSLFDLYPFKASSYIWVLGFLYFGMLNDYSFSSKVSLITLFIVLIINYYSSIFGISESYQSKILTFTDKFDYLKASDLIIFFLFFSYFLLKSNLYLNDKKYHVFLIGFSFFYLPLMMNKSRGASIAFVILIVFLFIRYFQVKHSIKAHFFYILVFSVLFIISSFIVSKSPLELSEIDDKIIYVSTGRYEKPVQNTPQNIDDYPIFYVEGTRFFSRDGNLNWRFQIWQDVVSDTIDKNKYIQGYGYNYKIPAMEPAYRSGNDGTNENVHNFLVNIYARGGLIHLSLFFSIFFLLYKNSKLKNQTFFFFLIFLPSFVTSFFDASMENAHYPLIFYFLIGDLIKEKVQ